MKTSTTLVEFRASRTTLANRERDFSEWHGGRRFYYCWTVMVTAPAWLQAVDRAVDALEAWLVPGYARQSHVTILPGGFIDQPLDSEEISGRASSISPFPLSLGPFGSFTSSPCFEIDDPDRGLLRLRKLLRPILFDPCSVVRDAAYQPHLTVGLYRDCFEADAIAGRISEFPTPDYAPIEVSEISLCAYETHTIKGPLTEIARIGLESGTLTILDQHSLFR